MPFRASLRQVLSEHPDSQGRQAWRDQSRAHQRHPRSNHSGAGSEAADA